ncbi:MAG: hypothetical protein ACNJA3_29040 (plasmid) [Pseudomonas rhizophila]|uniref:hypothetical protein n=1 Tax=Pseudomonas rhizophila TaxID=2045200 RepID=UPI003F6C3DB7
MTGRNQVFVACHRGADKAGAMSAQWFQVSQKPTSLEVAIQECQQLLDAGLIFHPHLSEFRICRPDGAAVQESNPPHIGNRLTWVSLPLYEHPNC